MRKSKLIKILVAVLSFSLLLGAIVGITTAADEADVYLESSDIQTNVKYESKTYLLYRVLKSEIKEEDAAALCLQIAKEDGTFVDKVAPKVEGDYYVFETQGVPAKELNTKEVVTVMSGDKAISPAITWSVEEYLYARLYADKYANETEEDVKGIGEDDGKDFTRRELYYDLLEVGVNAQKVLAPDAVDKIGDSTFVFANDALATYGRFDKPTNITLRHDSTKIPEGKVFLGWECSKYDAFGDLVEVVYAEDGSVLTTEGYVSVKPYYLSHSYLDFNDSDEIPSQILSTIAKNTDGTLNGTASIVDGKFVLTQDVAQIGNNYWYVNPTTKVDGANAVVFEADFSANIPSGDAYWTIYTGATSGDKIYWANLSIANGYLKIKTEYVCNPSQAGHSVELKTPIKLDGTTYKLRVIYRETEWGEDCLEFYADDVLFHTTNRLYASTYNTNQKGPDATGVGCFTINFGKAATGTMTLDNVAMTQVVDLPKFNKLGVDNDSDVITFDTSDADVKQTTTATENKYYSYGYDEKTGSKYLLLTKHETGSGLSFDVSVTGSESNADYAVFSYDYYMEDTVTTFANQIYLAHTKYVDNNGNPSFSNYASPIMVSMPTSFSSLKGKWIHVEITYEVLERDDNGLVTKIKCEATATEGANMSVNADEATGVYKTWDTPKLMFKIFDVADGIDVPEAEDLRVIRITLNNAAYGDVRFDNLSFKLVNRADN